MTPENPISKLPDSEVFSRLSEHSLEEDILEVEARLRAIMLKNRALREKFKPSEKDDIV